MITNLPVSPGLQGNITGKRQAILGNWFTDIKVGPTQDVVLSDGSFTFSNPQAFQNLSGIVKAIMAPGGVFVGRHFVKPDNQESEQSIITLASKGGIANFHIFKFKVAMSLQKSFSLGVKQGDIYDFITIHKNELSAIFNDAEFDTLIPYKDQDVKMYFPKLNELKDIFKNNFSYLQVKTPGYLFGECCPIVIAK